MAIVAGDLGHVAEHNRLSGVPLGTLTSGYAQVTANQTGITTSVNLTGLTVTVTVGSGRRIRISGQGWFSSSVASDTGQLLIQEGATVLNGGQVVTPAGAGQLASTFVSAILQPSAGAHTYKLTAARAGGSGSMTFNAGATFPAYILVEDIGV